VHFHTHQYQPGRFQSLQNSYIDKRSNHVKLSKLALHKTAIRILLTRKTQLHELTMA